MTSRPQAEVARGPEGTSGVLLINLGTPESPTRGAVARYLRQFLMDPRVLDLPAWRRFLLVNLLIVPFRSGRSANAYREIWTEEGSPLLIHGRELAARVAALLGPRVPVALGMRYGEPSIRRALQELHRAGCRRIAVLPLYAQATTSATSSSLAETMERAAELRDPPALTFVPPFFLHPEYLDAKAESIRPLLERERPHKVYFSFHGIPERQLRKSGSPSCLTDGCCRRLDTENAGCYRAQCFASARAIAERLALGDDRYSVAFQSRLGRQPWIGPHTDQLLEEEAPEVGTAVVVSSFVSDCLETLEELGIRASADWRAAGGERLVLAPALNAGERWVRALTAILEESAPWLGRASTDATSEGAVALSESDATSTSGKP